MKKNLLLIICALAILTTGCSNAKKEKEIKKVARKLAVTSMAHKSSEVKLLKDELNELGVEFRYVQLVPVNAVNSPRLKKYNLDLTNKKQCAITHYRQDNQDKFVGYCR